MSIPALLLYFHAVDSRTSQEDRQIVPPPSLPYPSKGRVGWRTSIWVVVAAAVLLSWAAALSKEIGITVLGAMMVYDLLLVPLDQRAAGPRPPHPKKSVSNSDGGDASVNCSKSGEHTSEYSVWRQAKWLRLALLCLAGILYVKARSFVAGDQLVRIYRKVVGISCTPSVPHTHPHSSLSTPHTCVRPCFNLKAVGLLFTSPLPAFNFYLPPASIKPQLLLLLSSLLSSPR